MKVTFLLGNGFDLSCGMKTRYTDFYPQYIAQASASPVIENFKQNIDEEVQRSAIGAAQEWYMWSDFEQGLGTYARQLTSENELIDCVRDFRRELGKYLVKEQFLLKEKLENSRTQSKIFHEIYESITEFYKKGFNQGVIDTFDEKIKDSNGLSVDFISFNYTTVLDQWLLLGMLSNGIQVLNQEVNHIHGAILEERIDDLALGVDNLNQLLEVKYTLTNKGERTLIKPSYNSAVHKKRVDKAKKTIEKSDIIYAYGLSMGKSDLMWKNALLDWLKEDNNHNLFYSDYHYSKANDKGWDEKLDMMDEAKQKLLQSVFDGEDKQIVDIVENQIFIPVGEKLFNLEAAMKEDNVLKELPNASIPMEKHFRMPVSVG